MQQADHKSPSQAFAEAIYVDRTKGVLRHTHFEDCKLCDKCRGIGRWKTIYMETQTGPQISPVFIDCCDKCSGKGCVVRKRKRRKDDRKGAGRWTEDAMPQSAVELMWSTPLYRFLIMETARYRVLFQTEVEINMVEGRA